MPYRLQFKWAICTGLRRFEICALTIGDLDRSTISCGDGLVQLDLMRKGGRLRSIYVPSDLIDETRWYILMDRPKPKLGADDSVFLSSSGLPMRRGRLTRKFRELADRLGIKCTLHHLRHTFALQVLERLQRHELAGEWLNAIKVVQVLMGHSSIETTEIYLDAMEITSDAVVGALGYLYGASL
ncbi:tyrosine-type recombinase/integrase [Massilia pseudoviolaceinigra]|uniref:tyrosine-type recombinase/integrase n=1 Tax=Massilia pseudoviolaceinigra TaxID=3057165 RepID=UPI0035B53098